MTLQYASLSKEDKRMVDNLIVWIKEYSMTEVLDKREFLEKRPQDYGYISKDIIYQDYLNIKDDLEHNTDYEDNLLFPLMEKLLGSRFKGFVDRYKRDYSKVWLKNKPSEEWFDHIDLLLDMDLEASGVVSIENIASLLYTDKEFDEKVIRLSKTRFAAIGKVFKKKFSIDKARGDKKILQVNKGHIFRDRYDSYLFMYLTPKLLAEAFVWSIETQVELQSFIDEEREILRELFSYKSPIGNERFTRVIQKIKRDAVRLFIALNKESEQYAYPLNMLEKGDILVNVMDMQTERYKNGNNILTDIDDDFIEKAVYFKALEKEHLRYHSQK